MGAYRSRVCLTAILFMALTSGCADRASQFKAFADAGTTYITAENTFLDAARDAAIQNDTQVLLDARANPPAGADFRTIINGADDNLKLRIALIAKIEQHGKLLQAYFTALSALAASNAPAQAGTASQNLMAALGAVSSSVKTDLAKVPAANSVAPAGTLVFSAFQVTALDSELRQNAPTIRNELALQQAVLKFFAREYRTDVQASLNRQELTLVVTPFISAEPPVPWSEYRKQVLTASIGTAAGDAAVSASTKLAANFESLVGGKLDMGDLQSMIVDTQTVVNLVQAMKGAQ